VSQPIRIGVESHWGISVTTVTVLVLKASGPRSGYVCSGSNVMVSYTHEDYILNIFTFLHMYFTRKVLSNTYMCKIFEILCICIIHGNIFVACMCST
jgi:hypothetical protein